MRSSNPTLWGCRAIAMLAHRTETGGSANGLFGQWPFWLVAVLSPVTLGWRGVRGRPRRNAFFSRPLPTQLSPRRSSRASTRSFHSPAIRSTAESSTAESLTARSSTAKSSSAKAAQGSTAKASSSSSRSSHRPTSLGSSSAAEEVPQPRRRQWKQLEDETVRRLVSLHGLRAWSLIAEYLPGRTGKQCRERWHNHLDESVCKEAWSITEERMLLELQSFYGVCPS